MRYFLSGLLIIVLLSNAQAQDSIVRKVVFLGDIGTDESVAVALREEALLDTRTTIVFLGGERFDTDRSGVYSDKILRAIEGAGANAIFVPGNGDWNNGKADGYRKVREKTERIKSIQSDRVKVLPADGCPGPEDVSLDENTELIIMDSQWWLHEYDKPGVESTCKYKTKQQVLDELEDKISDSRGKLVIFVTHHPFRSTGLGSGYFGIKQHVFPLTDINGLSKMYLPLPIIGSLYPITRSVWISRQNMTHSKYEEMVSSIDDILKEHPHLIRVAGHEHIMELYREKGNYYITSGAFSRSERAQKTPKTEYVSNDRGFVVLEITSSKKVNTVFYKVQDGAAGVAFSKLVMDFSTKPQIAEDTATIPFTNSDSVTAAVNSRFNDASRLKRWIMGENYRKEWATPVTLSTFNIGSDKGGFKIEGQGGGKQTTTIRLRDASGKAWSLRSITKDPEKVIPENFRHTLAQDALNDILSASHPFAAGPVTALSRALGIAAPQIEYYFVPNDTALGYYRPAFANTVAMLEERDPSLYGEETSSTTNIYNKRLETPGIDVDQKSYLKARMLDLLIGDFDRHYEQFKWGEREENGKKIIYVVPKDRDQAFFRSDGLIMKLFAYNNMPFLKGFRYDLPNPEWYGFVARDVDGLFLNQLDREDWKGQLSEINNTLTDSVIKDAVKVLPPAIHKLDSAAMTGKLISRRDKLEAKGLAYYDFLARKVNVTGTNLDEEFIVIGNGENVKVEVFQKDTAANERQLVYSRVFNEQDTKEIRLYGLNGNDVFKIGEDVATRIKFRIVGGKGKDEFDISGNAKNIIYDDASEDNRVTNRSRTTDMISNRRDVNSYEFRENTHNSSRIPTLNIGYNIEDQFMAGLGVSFTKHGFRKDPFASQHQVSSLVSFVNQAYQIKYSGEVIDIYRHYDLVMNAGLTNPHLNNFFGLGNETFKDPTKPLSYYRVRFSSLSGDLAIRKRLIYNKMSISAGTSFYYYWNNLDRNSGRILSYPADVGLDSTNIYTSKFYTGGHLALSFSTIKNDLLPIKGISWSTGLTSLVSVTKTGLPVTRLTSDLSLYAPLSSNRRFTFVLHTGGGHIFSDNFEYFQALTLGANNYLRGYRKNRFAGSTMAYASTELRMRLFKLESRILPGDVGLVGFNDMGRVWIKTEQSGKWHSTQGGGIYFTPFNLVMLSALVARSEEETLFNLSIGTRLNVTF